MKAQDFPVHDKLDVIDGATVYKTEEWWKAVVVFEQYGRKIGVYLWNWREDDSRWVRKQKYVVRKPEDWKIDRELIDTYLPLLEDERDDGAEEDRGLDEGPDIEAILKELAD